jgi:hypothetical protein
MCVSLPQVEHIKRTLFNTSDYKLISRGQLVTLESYGFEVEDFFDINPNQIYVFYVSENKYKLLAYNPSIADYVVCIMIECHLHINVIRTNLKNIIGEYN